MPEQQVGAAVDAWQDEILTLAEAASYLRVPEDALCDLANKQAVPARKIGPEWRFLKRALTDWLRHAQHFNPNSNGFAPPFLFGYPPMEELVGILEKHLLNKLGKVDTTTPKPGSKEAVLKYFGIWRDDPTLEGMLKDIYKRRRGEHENEE